MGPAGAGAVAVETWRGAATVAKVGPAGAGAVAAGVVVPVGPAGAGAVAPETCRLHGAAQTGAACSCVTVGTCGAPFAAASTGLVGGLADTVGTAG